MGLVTIDDPLPEKPPERERPRVCKCGHVEARHSYVASRGRYKCSAARGSCGCAVLQPVLEVWDARIFNYGMGDASTTGHPLVNGIRKSRVTEKQVRWLDGQGTCDVEDCDEPMATALHVDMGRATELRCKEHLT